MNKSLYSGLSILDLGKTVMFGFWFSYLKPNFVTWIKTGDIYKDIAEGVEQDLTLFVIRQTIVLRKNKKSIWVNKICTWTNHEGICWIKTKNI